MAENAEINCQIIRFEENPKGGQNVFVECSIGKRIWTKEVWVNYDRPISFEEFKRDLKKVIWPKNDEDQLRFVKEEAEKPFTIKTNRNIGSK